MKKIVLSLMVFSMVYFCGSSVSAISSDFKFVIDEIGVPQYNVKGKEINEDIYNVYNMFIYGSPTQVTSSEQRWKSFSTGKWCYGKSVYTGSGIRGEYSILGYDYSGNIVYNYYFPLDRVTSTPILQWKFLNVTGALESWNNAAKYYSSEQIDYMKNSKWWFQNISDGKNNPYNQIEYNLTAMQVGLNKVRLETPATWKTRGSVYIERRTESGGIGWAIFMIQPMSADAKVESNISCDLKFTLAATEEEILIPIYFGAELKELSKYAKAEHVKDITSILYYNDKEVARISGSKITSVGNEYMLVITRDKIPQNKIYLFNLKVRSYVKTEFSADGLLQDEKEVTVTVNVEPKIIIPLSESDLKVLSKNQDKWVVSPLAQNNETIISQSLGFTEAGRSLLIQNTIDKKVANLGDISNVEVYIDGIKIESNKVEVLKSKEEFLLVKLSLPINLNTTLYGWKSLRYEKQNYFEIDLNKILTRRTEPHKLQLKYIVKGEEYVEELLFDTIDDYISNMNNDVLNFLSVTKFGNEQYLADMLEE